MLTEQERQFIETLQNHVKQKHKFKNMWYAVTQNGWFGQYTLNRNVRALLKKEQFCKKSLLTWKSKTFREDCMVFAYLKSLSRKKRNKYLQVLQREHRQQFDYITDRLHPIHFCLKNKIFPMINWEKRAIVCNINWLQKNVEKAIEEYLQSNPTERNESSNLFTMF